MLFDTVPLCPSQTEKGMAGSGDEWRESEGVIGAEILWLNALPVANQY